MRKNKYIERKSEKERIITERRGEIPMKSMDICACQSATGAGKSRQAKKRTAEMASAERAVSTAVCMRMVFAVFTFPLLIVYYVISIS